FDDVNRTLEGANRARERLMRDGQWGPSAGNTPYLTLAELRSGSAAASNLSWTDETGERLYTALSPFPPPLNVASRSYFTAHRDNPSSDLQISAPTLSGFTGKYLVPVSRRFDLPDGRFGGVTTVLVDPFYFATFYQTTMRRQRVFVQLVLTDGTILVREPSLTSFMGTSIAKGQLFTEHLPKAQSGTFIGPGVFDGIQRIVTYKTIPKL